LRETSAGIEDATAEGVEGLDSKTASGVRDAFGAGGLPAEAAFEAALDGEALAGAAFVTGFAEEALGAGLEALAAGLEAGLAGADFLAMRPV
jgi:hypothetical protein